MVSSNTPPASSAPSPTSFTFQALEGRRRSEALSLTTCRAICTKIGLHLRPLQRGRAKGGVRLLHNYLRGSTLIQPFGYHSKWIPSLRKKCHRVRSFGCGYPQVSHSSLCVHFCVVSVVTAERKASYYQLKHKPVANFCFHGKVQTAFLSFSSNLNEHIIVYCPPQTWHMRLGILLLMSV